MCHCVLLLSILVVNFKSKRVILFLREYLRLIFKVGII